VKELQLHSVDDARALSGDWLSIVDCCVCLRIGVKLGHRGHWSVCLVAIGFQISDTGLIVANSVGDRTRYSTVPSVRTANGYRLVYGLVGHNRELCKNG
jgi:hypothetical protein